MSPPPPPPPPPAPSFWHNSEADSEDLVNMQVGLLNVDGYYNYLLTFIDKAVDDGFIKPSQRHIIVSAPNARELVQKLEVGGQWASFS